ncbi:MAG: hypothetical protein DRN66_01815 [Candidatus Nanohalarchaeota archaeon]|nr:MAG: hypothetical protein DRN66_01815 [Candidatus Nanohaloarchaeota archaeon]
MKYTINLIIAVFILIFYRENKKMLPCVFAGFKIPKPIKRIKISAFAAKSNAKKTGTPLWDGELKLKERIDEKKYILLRKNMLSVADVAASENTGEAKKKEECI